MLRKAAELNLTVVVHAAGAPAENVALRPYNLYRTLGRSLDSCLVAARLLVSGVLDELRGSAWSSRTWGAGSSCTSIACSPAPGRWRRGEGQRPLPPRAGTAPVRHGAVVRVEPAGDRLAAERLGVGRLALGSDYPVGPTSVLADAVAHVRALPLEAPDRARIRLERRRVLRATSHVAEARAG